MNSVMEYLELSASKYPDKTAYKDIQESVTFAELQSRVHAIGTRIAREGLRRKPVAVLMEKSTSMVVGILGTVCSGNFYCPIDVAMPVERMQMIFDILEPGALIVNQENAALLEKLRVHCQILSYEELMQGESDEELLEQILRTSIDTDPLYVLFTSGSTGTPKGVVVSHRVVINNMEWLSQEYDFGPEDILGNQVPFYFDVSDHDIYSVLKFGCSMVIIPKEHFMFPANLISFLNEHHVTAIFWVPFALSIVANLRALESEVPKYLRYIFFAGEVMPVKQLNYWIQYVPDALYVNMYGPTETYVCTYYNVDRPFQEDEALPIGYPVGNVDYVVLDEKDQLVTPDSDGQGELCIRGCTLASGYYRKPELTRERFTQNPLHNDYPDRIYRTGDLVRFNDRGELMYLSRKDFQIKHLGYRIELGEIETAVSAVEGVEACACIYDHVKKAIVLIYSGQELEKKTLLKRIGEKVPSYMMPNKVRFTADMPHNANGKIDRKKLEVQYL